MAETVHEEFYRRCDEVLYYVWDPIGVLGAASARDEYSSYVPGLYRLLVSGADEQHLATYLGDIARDRMGLSASSGAVSLAADLLVDFRDLLLSGGSS